MNARRWPRPVHSAGPAGGSSPAAPRKTSLAGRSRYSAKSVTVPDALREPAAFADAHGGARVGQEGASYVIPISEAALLALLPERERLPPGAIPWPGLQAVRAICDKRRVLEAAPAFGIGVPRQVVLDGPPRLRPTPRTQSGRSW